MDITEQKALLRKDIRAKRRELTDEERKFSALNVAEKLMGLYGVLSAKVILAYMPMKYELDILPAAGALRAMGKSIAFPLCIDNGGLRLFIPEYEGGFRSGAYGILEPDPSRSTEIDASDIDAIILPAIGFDDKLRRLGQGGGYYDRLLARTHCFTVAVGFDCQLVSCIPTEETDRKVDAVVTPSRVILPFTDEFGKE